MPGLAQEMATIDGGPSASLTRLCVVVESTGSMAGTWPGLRCVGSATVCCSVHGATANAWLGSCMRGLRGVRPLHIRTHVAVLLWSPIIRPLHIRTHVAVLLWSPITCRQRKHEPHPVNAARHRVHMTHRDATSAAVCLCKLDTE